MNYSVYTAGFDKEEVGYLDESGNIYKGVKGFNSEPVCLGYVEAGFHLGEYYKYCIRIKTNKGGISNEIKEVGYITDKGGIYDERKKGWVGRVEGNQIYDALVDGHLVGESDAYDLGIGAAYVLGLFGGPIEVSYPLEKTPYEIQHSTPIKTKESSTQSKAGEGGEPPSLPSFTLSLVLFAIGFVVYLFLLAVVFGLHKQLTFDFGYSVIKWSEVAATYIIPAVLLGITALIVFTKKSGDKRKKLIPGIVTIVVIIVHSVLIAFILPHECELIWKLLRFRNPATLPFLIYWCVRLAFAIYLAVMINRETGTMVKVLMRFNTISSIVVISQMAIWCLISVNGVWHSKEAVQLFFPIITMVLWFLTNSIVLRALNHRGFFKK